MCIHLCVCKSMCVCVMGVLSYSLITRNSGISDSNLFDLTGEVCLVVYRVASVQNEWKIVSR